MNTSTDVTVWLIGRLQLEGRKEKTENEIHVRRKCLIQKTNPVETMEMCNGFELLYVNSLVEGDTALTTPLTTYQHLL